MTKGFDALELRQALESNYDAVLALRLLVGAFESVAGEDTPDWLHVVRSHVERVESTAEALECILRQRVLPPLDLTGVSGA